MPPGPAAPMVPAANLASAGLRIVGGLIDVILIGIVAGAVGAIFRGNYGIGGGVGLVVTVVYLTYMWNSQGQSVGMMVFGFRVRDQATGQYPDVGKAVARAIVWWLEVALTPVCLIGFIGWGWQLWDARRQALHDKVVGTIVTAG